MRFEDVAALPQEIDAIRHLVIMRQFLVLVTGNDRQPSGIHPFGDIHDVPHPLQNFLTGILIVTGEVDFVFQIDQRNDDPHLHSQFFHRPGDASLIVDRTPFHAVVFSGREALIDGKLELVDEILARQMFEHPEMWSEFHREGCGRLFGVHSG